MRRSDDAPSRRSPGGRPSTTESHRGSAETAFASSVVAFERRGSGETVDGDPQYPGNVSGRFVEAFLRTYHRGDGLVIDPMEGSGTTGAVCRRLAIPYRGFDLRHGFDAQRDDLLARLEQPAQSAFLHPPYMSVKTYSGSAWGDAADDRDLSHTHLDIDRWSEMLAAILTNVHRALRSGGMYGVLIANQRRRGRLYHLAERVIGFAPGTLIDEIIKIQHGARRIEQPESATFVPIAHETLLVFRKDDASSIIAISCDLLERFQARAMMTWRSLVVAFAREHPSFSLNDLYTAFDDHPRTKTNRFWRDKLRQIVQDERTFVRLARGRFAART